MNLFDSLLIKWRKPMFFREIYTLHITPTEKVFPWLWGAFLGTIFIVKEKKINVVGIDNNSILVKLA
jgi:hypothetical protein